MQSQKQATKKLMEQAETLFIEKGQAYHHGNEDMLGQLRLAAEGVQIPLERLVLARLVDKVNRLCSFTRSQEDAPFESVEDTVIDIINYAQLFWVAYNDSELSVEEPMPAPSEYPSVLPGIHRDELMKLEYDTHGLSAVEMRAWEHAYGCEFYNSACLVHKTFHADRKVPID